MDTGDLTEATPDATQSTTSAATDAATTSSSDSATAAAAATIAVKESPSTNAQKAPSPIRTRRQLAALTNPQPTTTTAAAATTTKPVEEELPPPTPIIRVAAKRLEELLERLVDATKDANVHALEKIHVALSQVRGLEKE